MEVEVRSADSSEKIPDEYKICIYRLVQEALNNAIKHSGARNLSIQLTESAGAILLQIKDDGKGLDQPPRRSSGMGLHIMDYRAHLIGGNLQLQSGTNGTTVSCSVPLNAR